MRKYKTFWGRFWAGIIDGLVFLPLGILDFFFLNININIGLAIIWVMVIHSAYLVYSICFHWKTGQTIGKKLMKVKVIDVSEEKGLSLKQSLLRDSFYVVLQILGIILIVINIIRIGAYSKIGIDPYDTYLFYVSMIWFWIEIITMLTNKKRRAFHDIIASTVVINLKETNLPSK